MKLGDRIKKARKAAGLSQVELASRCGWDSASRVGNYEQGSREPSLADLMLIASFVKSTEYSLYWLLTGEETPAGNSQSQRPTIPTVISAARVVSKFRERRGAKFDLTNEDDAELFVEALAELQAMPDPSADDQIELGAKIAELAIAREARHGREREKNTGEAGKSVRKKAAGE